ncbi:MAG TPA: phosphoribosylformylglycinamidine synthase subunit PurS, partial [Ktedonobacteraceae bacterium]|nr:phosphoribosylformylglycinamidine synthase subunit PurS [Ktedonobacteraceae bacterium]
MTVFQIEVRAIAVQHDVQAHQLAREILFLPQLPSFNTIAANQTPLTSPSIRTAQLYRLTGNLDTSQINQLITNLLVDPVVQEASLSGEPANHHVIDVFFLPGVTDTLAESVLAGARMLGIPGLEHVETGRRYMLDSHLSEEDVRIIAGALLYNPVIQQYVLHAAGENKNVGALHIVPSRNTQFIAPKLTSEETQNDGSATNWIPALSIPITSMTDQELLDVSKKGLLALNLDEMHAIQHHYREQGREPTDVELETLAQTWSEHCSHKTFKATIRYRELDSDGSVLEEEIIDGLLRQYIMCATEQVKQPWLVSAFSDNAGIIRFTETQDLAFKVETHNHPSAIEPFGGANTGVGGVIRDVLGVSAEPIACTDILCFGPADTPV